MIPARTAVFQCGRLLSLLEIMELFPAAIFFAVSQVLEAIRAPIVPLVNDTRVVDKDSCAAYLAVLAPLEPDCAALHLKASTATLRKIIRELSQSEPTYGALRLLVVELQGRLKDEMAETVFMSLSPQEAEYFRRFWLGWEDILERFPEALGDIEEAKKCFAVSRYAATVFHSIQIVEAGLIELGKFIDVADPKSGWTAVADKLKKIIAKKHDDRTEFEKLNFEFLEQAQGTVEALKNAWRNKVSHVQGRLILMTTDFTREVAEEILFATRAFMRRLVHGLPNSAGDV